MKTTINAEPLILPTTTPAIFLAFVVEPRGVAALVTELITER
jgi:hypothetical protein